MACVHWLRDPDFGHTSTKGKTLDAGDKLGYLEATVELALKNPKLGKDFRAYLKGLKL